MSATTTPPKEESRSRGYVIALGASVAGLAVLFVGWLVGAHDSSGHCGDGFIAIGGRCCAEGQSREGDRCTGKPTRCGPSLTVTDDGCAAPKTIVAESGGSLRALSLDWDAAGRQAPGDVVVAPFRIDAFEVTWAHYTECSTSGKCIPLTPVGEPGQPVNRVNVYEAARYCAFASGRLPSENELLFAAAGSSGRRFPWGPNGAVCRRAAWGLSVGPCFNGSSEPDVTGSHPDGRTPEGVEDLAGNVAEWTLPRPDGTALALGGSFRDREATALKSWSGRSIRADSRADDIGFRCVYEP